MDKIESSHLYQYLRSYLFDNKNNDSGYGNLMNTSKGLFAEIKRDTIIYHIRRKQVLKGATDAIYRLKDRVTNPKRQIVLTLTAFPSSDLSIIFFLSPYLWKIVVFNSFTTFTDDFDFSIFNNIPIVELDRFSGITQITSGFRNVEELSLSSFYDLEYVYDMNVTGSLKKLSFYMCYQLKSVFPQTDVCDFSSLVNNQTAMFTRLEFTIKENQHNLMMNGLFPNQLSVLHVHHLPNVFLVNFSSSLLHLKELSLFCTDKLNFPAIPGFYGNNLSLNGFDLSSWSRNEFQLPNLRSLTLTKCRKLRYLPTMVKLKSLFLLDLNDLEIIPTCPVLRSLSLYTVSMKEIQPQPHICTLAMSDCSIIQDLNGLNGNTFRFVNIRNCGQITDLTPLRNSIELRVELCSGVRNVRMLTSCHEHRHRWCFVHLPDLGKFDQCTLENLPELVLENTPVDRLQFRNIEYLMLRQCDKFTTTVNIQNISQTLILHRCASLSSLISLLNIPDVALLKLPSLTDFSGLGNHKRVCIYEVPFLEKAARNYRIDLDEGREKENAYYSIFSTIEYFSVLELREDALGQRFSWDDIDEDYEQEVLWGEVDDENDENDDDDD